jgi:multidrug efflux pump subunit AcrA (membrane-fusion protein)
MITLKPLSSYYTDDDKAVIARKAELAATGKRRQAELTELDTAIATQGDIAPDQDDQVQNLIAGLETPRPQPLAARRTELQYVIRDIEQALDFMAGKERQVTIKAGARLAKDIKPQVDIAERELVEALVIAHEKHLTYFNAKRHLINGGIGLNGLFASGVDGVLGIPVDKGTPLADLFRAAVRAGYLKSAPKDFR